MGLGPSAVRLNLELFQRGLLKGSVIEMGSQELHLKKSDFEELARMSGIDCKGDFANLKNWPGYPRCPSKVFYEMLGIKRYSCIDLGGHHGAIPLDLNSPLQDHSLYGQYDLVTDYGNNEHVFNTIEAYRTMHRLCKQSGLMAINQTFCRGNGYYGYDPSFFEGMAAANNYKIIFSAYVITANTWGVDWSKESQFYIPISDEALGTIDWTKISEVGICYVMQKQKQESFQYPYQGQYLSKAQGHYGYRLQFLAPPSRAYLPIFSLETIPARSLLWTLFYRIVKKLTKRGGKNDLLHKVP